MTPTLDDMQQIATDLGELRDRVFDLEKRKEAASYAPQNSYYINAAGKTVNSESGSVSIRQQPVKTLKAHSSEAWNALPTAVLGALEVLSPASQVAMVSFAMIAREFAFNPPPFTVALWLNGKEINTWLVEAIQHTLSHEVKESETFEYHAIGTVPGYESGGVFHSGVVQFLKSNSPINFAADTVFTGHPVAIVLPEGENLVEVVAFAHGASGGVFANEVSVKLQLEFLAVKT